MGRSVTNNHSFLLAKSAVVSAIFKDGGTQHSTSVTESRPQTAKITRKHSLSIILQLIAARSSRVSKWKDCNQKSMMSSLHHGHQVRRQPTTGQCRDGCSFAEDGATSPTCYCKCSPWFSACFVHTRARM